MGEDTYLKYMIKCPLCKKEVEKLKEGSHIIPRWMILPTKQQGTNVYVNIRDGITSLNDRDYKGTFSVKNVKIKQLFLMELRRICLNLKKN